LQDLTPRLPLSRYERGQAKPVVAVINSFKLLDKPPDLIKELNLIVPRSFGEKAVLQDARMTQ
jgi:hypothetical protein